MTYEEIIESKRHKSAFNGIEPVFMPDQMFDYQKHVAGIKIRKGQCAGFLDTGTGKTIIELVIAMNYRMKTGKPTLIMTPLAVAFQFIKEAEKFGIEGVEYSREGKFSGDIIVCNYERLHYFKPSDFGCVICDEASILKNDKGAIRSAVTQFMKLVPYRYLATATPSPNDYIELGTSSEALGGLGYVDMLTRFFANNENNIRPMDIGNKFYLKPHAIDDFFRWVSSWSISMRRPSDLGFSDDGFVLPELATNFHAVRNDNNWVIGGQIMMFNGDARRMSEVSAENKETIKERCEKAVELACFHDTSVYWCNLNTEGDLLKILDKDSIQLKGSMKLEQKEEILLAFANGEIKKLITKPKITSFGLNWQHCGHTVYFPTFSYEQYYQAIRRFWRYGRTEKVTADIVHSDGQKRVIMALMDKAKKADELFTKLNSALNSDYQISTRQPSKQIIQPSFI